MSESSILVVTYVLVGLVVAAYIWFVVWRVRAERRKKAADEAAQAPMRAALATAFDLLPTGEDAVADSAPVAAPVAAGISARQASNPQPQPHQEVEGRAPVDGDAPAATVAACLSGVQLPCDLTPLTTMASRPNVGDRVAFWTNTTPAEVVGPAFADELERLGYSVTSLDLSTLAAQRDEARLIVVLHPDGLLAVIGDKPAFPSIPERSVVIETWVPE
ncbi:MAG TPA: hypothetical protein VGJ03_01585 [Acidimicrobiales bacterium]